MRLNTLFLQFIWLISADMAFAERQNAEKKWNIEALADDQSIVIDGLLNDEFWQDQQKISDFHQVKPKAFADASEKTEVMIGFDSQHFYVAAKLYEKNMSTLKAGQLIQGRDYEFDDQFHVVLDTFNNQLNGYFFQVNPHGVRREALINDDSFHGNWDAIWHAKTQILGDAWVVEMAIPLKSISFDPAVSEWGINFGRVKRNPNEVMAWSSLGSDNWEMNPKAGGQVTGLSNLEQGLGLDVKVTASITGGDHEGDSVEPSFDVFYKPSADRNLVATFNTDFSATEVDDRVVNLTRFSVFLPEKRSFFLEDMDIFEFGQINGNGKPFFSRRIGLDTSGQPADIRVGFKFSGRSDVYNYGLLGVQQSDQLGETQNLFVGRVQRGISDHSQIGMIATMGNPSTGNNDSLLGVDYRFRTNRFLGDKNFNAGAWLQQSDTEGTNGQNKAYGINWDYPNGNKDMTVRFSSITVEENFDPVLGFVNRSGIRQHVLQGGKSHVFEDAWWASYNPWIRLTYITDLDQRMKSKNYVVFPTTFNSSYGDYFQSGYEWLTDVLDVPFEIHPGVIITAGRHDYGRSHAWFESSLSRKMGGSLLYRKGEFFNGTQEFIKTSLFWRPNEHFHVSASYETTDNEFPSASFRTELFGLRKEVAFDADWSWLTVVQYDNLSGVIGVNSRLNWLPSAQSSVHLIYNSESFRSTQLFDTPEQNIFTLKYSYTFRR